MVEVTDSPSVLLNGMAGSRLPIVVAHGEGRAEFRDARHLDRVKPQVALRLPGERRRHRRALPGESERLTRRYHRADNKGRAGDRHNAPSGEAVSRLAVFLEAG